MSAAVVLALGPAPAAAQTFSLTQITNTPPAGFFSGFNAEASINAAGTRIAFVSNRNLTPGSPGNADGNLEIFLFDTATGLFTQITNTTGGVNERPSIDAGGTRIAFSSNRNLTPGSPGNADGNAEIFVFDTATGRITQITSAIGLLSSFAPSINADGSRIAFWSQVDLTPGLPGNPDANPEIYLFDASTGRFTQITDNTGSQFAVAPSINADGSRIAFESNGDLTPGNPGNADGNREIFLAIGPSGPASIPTLSAGMQLALAALLLLAGLYVLGRAQRSAPPGA